MVSFGIPACLKDRAVNPDVPGLCALIRGSLIEHRRLQIGDRGADRDSWAVGAKSWIMDARIVHHRRTGPTRIGKSG